MQLQRLELSCPQAYEDLALALLARYASTNIIQDFTWTITKSLLDHNKILFLAFFQQYWYTSLVSLSLGRICTDELLECIVPCCLQIQRIELCYARITDSSLLLITQKLHSLKSFTLRENSLITDFGIIQ